MRQSPASFNSVSDCAPCEYKRTRRRGPRSSLANLRRALPKRCRALPGVASGESEALTPVVTSIFQPQLNSSINSGPSPNLNSNAIFKKGSATKKEISIFVLNIQCLQAHLVELEYHLDMHKPHIVLLQETWLDASTESVTIANYNVVSRRDRSERANRGGVLTLARSDFNRLAHIENSTLEERSWHYLHMDSEILLLGNWYRPGATEHDAYAALQEEMGTHVLEATGIILSGDLNVHHARWLRFSNGNTVQGSDLKAVCDNLGLQQLVSEPTRQQYLLDLYLTDVAGTKVRVGPYIADHKYLIATVPMPEVTTLNIKRERFNLLRADWTGLKTALANVDWSPMRRDTADAAASYFMEMLWMNLCTYIPYEQIEIKKNRILG